MARKFEEDCSCRRRRLLVEDPPRFLLLELFRDLDERDGVLLEISDMIFGGLVVLQKGLCDRKMRWVPILVTLSRVFEKKNRIGE